MYNRFIYGIVLSALTLLAACDENKFINSPQQIVVEGWIDEGGFPIVILTKSIPVNNSKYYDIETLDDHIIKWAKVTVSDGDREVILTGKSSSDYSPPYIYTTGDMRGVAGKSYKLTVTYEDFFAEAITTIPQRSKVEGFTIDKNGNDYILKARINDNPNEKNYYKFFIKVITRDNMYLSSNLATIDDSDYEFPADIPLNIGNSMFFESSMQEYSISEKDRLLIKFAQIDSAAYLFWDDYKNMLDLGRNPFFRFTNNIHSNINGGIGYWFGYGATEYMCPPYKHTQPIILNE